MIRILFAVMLTAMLLGAEMKVGTNEGVRAAVKKVQPDYNPVAKQMRVQGDVEVEAQVDDKGDVKDVKVVSGNALLTAGVVKAVKEWKFTPFSEGGKTVPAAVSLRFSFKL